MCSKMFCRYDGPFCWSGQSFMRCIYSHHACILLMSAPPKTLAANTWLLYPLCITITPSALEKDLVIRTLRQVHTRSTSARQLRRACSGAADCTAYEMTFWHYWLHQSRQQSPASTLWLVLCLQPPEQLFHHIAQGQWMPTNMRWCEGKIVL